MIHAIVSTLYLNTTFDRCSTVLGHIQNVQSMKSSKNDSEKVLTKFDLFDGRYTIVILIISFNSSIDLHYIILTH